MKRKLNASDECSRGDLTATTAGLTFASHSLSSLEHPAQESRCQVAFCEQTAKEMTELHSPMPSAPIGNSLFAWSDDEDDDSTISVDSNVHRQLFPEDEEEDHLHHEWSKAPLHETSIAHALDSFTRNEEESIGATTTPRACSLRPDYPPSAPASSQASHDETSSLPSEIHLCGPESPDWLGSKEEKKIVQNIHVISQQQSMQVDQLTQRTAELEQEVHTTLMNSPLFQRYNRRSPFKKRRQEVLQAIDVALDHQSSSSPVGSSFCWQDHCDLWLRYGWHRLEDTFHLGVWEWVPLEWLTIYYYLWAWPSAQTRWTVLLVLGVITVILLCSFRVESKTSHGNLVHFSQECISVTVLPEDQIPDLQTWLL